MSKIIGVTVGTPMSVSTIKEKIKPVTSVNGIEADENGNVNVEAGGGSVQSDLNVNDETDPAYVKNRTHYKEVVANYVWDGSFDGLVDIGGMYMIRYDAYTSEELAEYTFSGEAHSIVGGGVLSTADGSIDLINDAQGNTLMGAGDAIFALNIITEDGSNEFLSVVFGSPGFYIPIYNLGDVYVTLTSWITVEKYHGLPSSYLEGVVVKRGVGTSAESFNSSVEMRNQAVGVYSHAEGYDTFAGYEAERRIDGKGWTIAGGFAHAQGFKTNARGIASHSQGYKTDALNFASCAIGKYNKTMTDGGRDNNVVGDVFVIGNGKGAGSSLSNAFRVTYAGETYGLSAFNSSGADYAEFFEWADLNPNAEDRVGYFVTLDGKHIRIAKPGDYILGIVSGQPCIIGNSDEDWLGRWEHDEFGRFIKEDVETPVTEMRPVEVPLTDANGKQILNLTKTEMQEVETGEVIKGWRYKANPNYDSTQKYIERKDRQEWDCVGMLGVLSVRDDGTCKVDGFCSVADGGIATEAVGYVPGMTYRVIERASENVVKVVFR